MPGGEEEEEGEAQVLRHGVRERGREEGRGEAVAQHLPSLWAAGAVGNGWAELLDQFSALFVLHAITQTPASLVQVPMSPGVLRVL